MCINRLLALFILSCYCAAHDAQYECGSHGRFEYCIDGIPGCVVGCHCHPGYYFDTDSKICEPNIKLTLGYRHHYSIQPTRRVEPLPVPPVTNQLTATANNSVDDKIEEIAKDAGDLGDWLYNQFFKTIENQVMNQTQEQSLTRRSGSVAAKKKPKTKCHKFLRKHGKKRKYRKSGLKNKLLRITEDDSLFDSSSSSSSDESSSSSTDNDSGTSSKVDKNKDHGHKKILIYNKKPRPPLPSFIFMPNMDTPFYPPIGLPPPPGLPMYPMVPVPPVGPMYPFAPGTTPNCDDSKFNNGIAVNGQSNLSPTPTHSNNGVITTTPTTTASVTITTTTAASDPNTSVIPDMTTTSDEPTTKEPGTRSKLERSGNNSKKGRKLKYKQNNEPQKRLIQKIKDKLDKRNKNTPLENFSDQYQDIDESLLNRILPQNYPKAYKKQNENFEDGSPMEDVDFKYITELIHRAKQNNKTRVQNSPYNDIFVGIPRPPSGRRSNYYSDGVPQPNFVPMTPEGYRSSPRLQNSDDSYYTNLGRQIASMIRKIDSRGERQINIEIEGSFPSTTIQPSFDENSYPFRSYWDRYIRSLEKKYPTYSKEEEYLRNSNEKLINIENKVELAVSTTLPLSLPELENLINEMKNMHNRTKHQNIQMNQKQTESNPFQSGYELDQNPNNSRRNEIAMELKNTLQTPEQSELFKNLHINLYNELIKHFATKSPANNYTGYKTNVSKRLVQQISPTRRSFNDSALKIPLLSHLQFLSNLHNIPINQMTKKPNYPPYPINPTTFNHKNPNYHPDNSFNQYFQQQSTYPLYFLDNTRKLNQYSGNTMKPAYFHHDFHHFDYFDE